MDDIKETIYEVVKFKEATETTERSDVFKILNTQETILIPNFTI